MILLKKRQDVLRMVKFNKNLEAIFVTFDLNCHEINLIHYLVFDSFLPIETWAYANFIFSSSSQKVYVYLTYSTLKLFIFIFIDIKTPLFVRKLLQTNLPRKSMWKNQRLLKSGFQMDQINWAHY